MPWSRVRSNGLPGSRHRSQVLHGGQHDHVDDGDHVDFLAFTNVIHIAPGPTAEPTVGLAKALEAGLEGVRGGEHQMAESDRRTICRRGSRGGVPHVGDPYDAGLLPDFFRVTPSLGSALSQAT